MLQILHKYYFCITLRKFVENTGKIWYFNMVLKGEKVMSIENINGEYLNTLSLKEKAELKTRLESNLRIQKMLYNYEKSKSTEDKER